jgi:hypothetical protein
MSRCLQVCKDFKRMKMLHRLVRHTQHTSLQRPNICKFQRSELRVATGTWYVILILLGNITALLIYIPATLAILIAGC